MDQKEALASLETIRTILERSTNYTHIAPSGIVAGGAVAIAAAAGGAALGAGPDRAPALHATAPAGAPISARASWIATGPRRR